MSAAKSASACSDVRYAICSAVSAASDVASAPHPAGVAALAFCPAQPCWLAVARAGGAGADVFDTRMLAPPAAAPLLRASLADDLRAADEAGIAHAPPLALAALTALAWSSGAGDDVALWLGDAAGVVRRLELQPAW